jgi:hypothetical protein
MLHLLFLLLSLSIHPGLPRLARYDHKNSKILTFHFYGTMYTSEGRFCKYLLCSKRKYHLSLRALPSPEKRLTLAHSLQYPPLIPFEN